MRKIFMALAVVSVFTACNSKSKTDETTNDIISIDTSNLYNSGAFTDTASLSEVPVVPVPKSSAKKAAVKPVVKAPKSPAPTTTPVDNNEAGTATNSTTSTPAKAEEKKGMSNAAKGAIIGGVGGAVGGAIISKKKGKGAIIGGAVGAAGGYILGRRRDKNQADTTK